ncbi:hypothetical protein, partial [Pseudomonas sp. AF1]|uniref:hypothetical protein n=1 Tax=Pseudomonas sp. AF1 TaxID=2806610 RepID=UPI001EEE4DDF
MKELNDIEVTCVSGGTLSGMIVGAVDRAATRQGNGGKRGGAELGRAHRRTPVTGFTHVCRSQV